MTGNTSDSGAIARPVAAPQHVLQRGALDWLASLNPREWRKRDGTVNKYRIALSAGLPNTTFWRQANGDDPLSEPVMSALVALAMLHGASEDEARKNLFAFRVPPQMAAAIDKARRVREAIAQIEAAA